MDENQRARSDLGPALRLPSRDSFPRVDDHLVELEITRDEIIGGRHARQSASRRLEILEARGVAVSEAQRREILACRDLARLGRWLRRAALASSADEVASES